MVLIDPPKPQEFDKLKSCIITGMPISKENEGLHYEYQITFGGRNFTLTFCRKCFAKIQVGLHNKRYIIRGLLLNRKLDFDTKIIHWENEDKKLDEHSVYLKKEIENGIYPRRPKELYDNLFNVLYERYQIRDFEERELAGDNEFAYSNYFKSPNELLIYFNAMKKDGLFADYIEGLTKKGVRITYNGLSYFIKTFEEGYASTKCFVAMSFQKETEDIRNAIKAAILSTGFEPVLIDELNINSDKTINDEIIANLKKCKFCVADFTYHKNGVYFESGFALGQGKPVIYTCRGDEFSRAHFDIKPLQHIIYDTPEELTKR